MIQPRWSDMAKSSAMLLVCLWMLLVGGFTLAAEDSREQCLARAAACTSKRPVCGSDSVTYPTRCHLLRAQCQGVATLTVQHRGRCRNSADECRAVLEYAKKHRPTSGEAAYVPTCRPDGTYKAVQCHQGLCWCVDAQGQPQPHITVKRNRAGKPRCSQRGKSATRRRSSNGSRKQKKDCTRADKVQFNTNLINNFQKEWERIHSKGDMKPEELDKVVLEWKFKDMDKNWDGTLDKTEYRDLRKLVKKFVKPKRCSKSFARDCDRNGDQQITRLEWNFCLKHDDNSSSSSQGGNGRSTDNDDDDPEDEYDDLGGDDFPHSARRSPPHGILQPLASSSQTSDSGERRDDEATDCLSDRQTVLNERSHGGSDNMFVPECTPDGRYKKVQCYKSVGYCWCVHEDTGKNIPGTSVQHAEPRCDAMPAPARPMKGCPEPKKTAFLKDLMDFFYNRMLTGTNDTNITGSESGTWQASKEEKAATWNFVVFDKNKNKVLERKEWKTFRSLVSPSKQLRRCGKKLPRYCDVNHDRKISMTEWLDCLNTKRNVQETASPRVASQFKRRGPNPLDEYLRDD